LRQLAHVNKTSSAFDKADPKRGGTKISAAPLDLLARTVKKLPPEKAIEFQNLVAKTVFATKRARLDTCTSVSFLTTRVRLEEIDTFNEISQGNAEIPTYPQHRRQWNTKVVGGCFCRDPSQYAWAFWWRAVFGESFPIVSSIK
jgi:hypothetical protein